jgi:hypothetical protein
MTHYFVCNNHHRNKIVFCFSFDRQIEHKKKKRKKKNEDSTEKWMDDLIQQPYNLHI